MYDELIGRLRVNGELFQKYIPNAEGEILLQAADAIEELQAYVALYKDVGETAMKVANDYKARLEELSAIREEQRAQIIAMAAEDKPRWIPVTEQLPECDLGAEVGNIEWISCGMVHAGCFGRGGKYRDAYFRTWTDAGEGMDAKDADYWRAVTLPEPPKEELA